MKVYISGGMSDHFALNFKEFYAKQLAFEELGFTVISPAQNAAEHLRVNEDVPRSWEEWLAVDRALIRNEADAIYVMKGYTHSRGAMEELAEAVQKGIIIMYEDNGGDICPK